MQEQAPVAIIIAAMSEEVSAFADLFGGVPILDGPVGGHDPHQLLDIGGATVAVRRSGIGFTNATAAVAHGFHDFGPGIPVISVGTAGGLMHGIAIGDVVVGDRYVNLNADATAFGYALGQVPGMPTGYAPDARLVELAMAADIAWPLRSATIGSSEVFVTEGAPGRSAGPSPTWPRSTWSPPPSRSSRTSTTCRSCRSGASATCARPTVRSSASTWTVPRRAPPVWSTTWCAACVPETRPAVGREARCGPDTCLPSALRARREPRCARMCASCERIPRTVR